MSNFLGFDKDLREEWLKIIAAAFAFLAFLGLSKSIIFYKLFGINILSYTKWDDFILISFEDLLGTIIFFVLGSFFPFLFFSNATVERESKFSFSKRVSRLLYSSIRACVFCAIVLMFVLPLFYDGLYPFESLLLIHSRWYSIAVFWGMIILFFGVPVFIYGVGCIELLLYVRKLNLGQAFNIYRVFITFCCFTLYVEVGILCTQYVHIKDNRYKGSTFETAKTIYKIDDENIFIGRTKEYIFIKSYKKDKIVVIPVVQVIEENINKVEWKYEKVRKI